MFGSLFSLNCGVSFLTELCHVLLGLVNLGISNSCRDLPGRKVGIARAYVEKAMEYGLDAGIVNAGHHFGEKPADPGLVDLVDTFAKMDGSAEKMTDAMMLMGKFCQENRKSSSV